MTAAKLIRPSIDYKDSYIQALREFQQESRYKYYNIRDLQNDFEGFVDVLRAEKGKDHRPYPCWVDVVPESVLWMVKDLEYIGSIYIRHRLNWHLEKWGGHIKLIIRPTMRKKGFGKKMLKKVIPYANYIGIDKALITIDPDNAPAKRIIEFCGGIEESTTPQTEQFPSQTKYWIDCT